MWKLAWSAAMWLHACCHIVCIPCGSMHAATYIAALVFDVPMSYTLLPYSTVVLYKYKEKFVILQAIGII